MIIPNIKKTVPPQAKRLMNLKIETKISHGLTFSLTQGTGIFP